MSEKVLDRTFGRVTLPTDLDVIPETIETMKRLGADALRDCDGTEFPEELTKTGAKIYSTYYTTRKDNEWAKKNPDEVQQCYIMTGFYTATEDTLSIPLLKGISGELMQVNDRDDVKRWWEVIDRSTGAVVPVDQWEYDRESGCVVIRDAKEFHEYTVSFLAYLIWDPVHMYNAVTNDWKDFEHQITFDVRQPKTRAYSMERLRKFCESHPYVNVIRYTTFFHQFTLVFDEMKREKYVDWYGYSASVSPYILEQFENEVGYKFRPEYIIDQGYYNNQYRVPSKEFKDFQAFQRREVAKLAKEMVDITHEYGKEAMMFLGDHWIGTEPFMDEFKTIGLDAVVGSVGNGSTLRLISDIKGVKYTEGRFLPYFFPDTFHEGGDPVKEAKENWVTARRAILRSPIDRIGYGGYLKLALEFPKFIEYIESVCNEFRELYANAHGTTPHCVKKVAVLNSWGKIRSWGCHMVHHALYQKQNYSYAGVIEALSGAPFDVRFISFDDIKENPAVLNEMDVVINVGDGDTAHTGGAVWEDPVVSVAVRRFVYNGGGFIGVGEPSGHQYQGHYLQLAKVLGVEKETGFTLNYDKYNWEEHPDHFILDDVKGEVDFGEGKKSIYAFEGTKILIQKDKEVQMAVNEYGKGRAVYISGLPYSFENSRVLYRSILWSANAEAELNYWFSTNYNVEVHAYVKNNKFCVVNNTYEPQDTVVYRGDGSSFKLHLDSNEIKWYEIDEAYANFQIDGTVVKSIRYGSGHINDTFLLTLRKEDDTEGRVILQRMNKSVFTNPVELMENIQGVTSFLRKKIIENGGDPDRETLNVIPAKDGKPYFVDSEGDYWRAYLFIEDATSYDKVEKPEDFYQSAIAFGNFQSLLADYPAETLHETIVGFHDTKARYETFKKVAAEDICGRAASVKAEIDFVLQHEDLANVFSDLLAKKEIPLRVTHNDTKLNNIMIDNKTGKGVCVIDLDTVMPGLAMHDFGDAIRFGANTAAEDEKDLDKVWFDIELFDIYTKGFIEGCNGKLTKKEIELLPMGAKAITFECGMRFLTDYLQGDTYFKVHREGHNLDRCRTQFKMVSDMEAKWDAMNEVIKKYSV